MKVFYLVYHNLRKMFCTNCLLFILVIISSMVSTFGIIFFAGYLAGDYNGFITVRGDEFKVDHLSKKVTGESIWQAILALDRENITDIECFSPINSSEQYEVVGGYHERYRERMCCGEFFQIEEKRPIAIIEEVRAAEISQGELPLGLPLKIRNKECKIAGVCTITERGEIILPVAFFLDNFTIESIKISMRHIMTNSQRISIEAIFAENGIDGLVWKSPDSPWTDFDFWSGFIQILLIFVVICINILILIFYLLYRMKRNFCIYSICGGEDKYIFYVIFLQTFLHLLVGILFGVISSVIFFSYMKDVTWLLHGNALYYSCVVVCIILMYFLFSILMERKASRELEIYQIME